MDRVRYLVRLRSPRASRSITLITFHSFNHGQCCCAGSRVYVQESIYDTFLQKFTDHVKSLKVGDPFHPETFQGPQVSKVQFDVRFPPAPFFLAVNLPPKKVLHCSVSWVTSKRARKKVLPSISEESNTVKRDTSSSQPSSPTPSPA